MAKRLVQSLGKHHFNDGEPTTINSGKYEVERKRRYYIFDVVPMGAVRMTKSDKWKTNPNHVDPLKRQRGSVTKYWAFKNTLVAQANLMNFKLGKCLDAVYCIPMPNSWSNKKKDSMNGMPCESKPDTDNITKGVKDALLKDDSSVWWEKAEKRWAYTGSIIIYQ